MRPLSSKSCEAHHNFQLNSNLIKMFHAVHYSFLTWGWGNPEAES